MSTDRRTIQLVVITLGLIALVGICGVVFLLSTGHKAGDLGPLTSPMSVAIGAVAALLVSTRTGNDPQPAPPPPPIGQGSQVASAPPSTPSG